MKLEHHKSSHFVLGQRLGVRTDYLGPSLLHRSAACYRVLLLETALRLRVNSLESSECVILYLMYFSTGRVSLRYNCCFRLSRRQKFHFVQFEISPAAASAAQFVSARRIRVVLRPEAFEDCISCSISGTICAWQGNLGRIKARGVQRLHLLQHQWHSSYLPEAHGSSKGRRRSEVAPAAASVAQFVPARKPGSS